MTDLCRHAAEMSYDREDDATDTYILTANQADMFPNEWKSNDIASNPLRKIIHIRTNQTMIL